MAVRVRPLSDARFDGLRVLGAPLHVVGRVRPPSAGALTLSSHGCVRLPLWFAPRISSRWEVGARVRVLP